MHELTSKGSCCDYGAAKSLLKELQNFYTWLTRDQVNYQVKLTKKELENQFFYTSSSALQLLQSHSEEWNSNKGGRPKGAIASANLDIETQKRKSVTNVTRQFCQEICDACAGLMESGSLGNIITTVLDKSNLKTDTFSFKINESILCNQIKRNNNLMKSTFGPQSPLASIEPYPVEIYLQKERMGQPLKHN